MTPKQYVTTFARFWWLILLVTAIGCGVGASQNPDGPDSYSSSARVAVVPTKARAATLNDRYLVSVRAAQAVAVAKSRMPLYAELIGDPELLTMIQDESGTELTPGDLADHATVSVITDSTSLQVSFTDPDPSQAQEVSGEIADGMARLITKVEKDRKADTLLRGKSVGEASVPTATAQPPAWRNPAIGLIAGLALGLALAVLAGRVDPKVRDRDAVEEILGAPVLAVLPPPRSKGRRAAPTHSGPEPIEELRTNIFFLRKSTTRALRIAMTSVAPVPDTSILSAALADSLADTGAHVLLLDARPGQKTVVVETPAPTEETGLLSDDGGLAEDAAPAVTGQEPADSPSSGRAIVVRPRDPHSGGTVVIESAGQGEELSDDFLHSATFEAYLDRASRAYDFVIVATDTVVAGNGALAVAARADLTLVATQRRGTRRRTLAQARVDLQHIRANVAGAVITP